MTLAIFFIRFITVAKTDMTLAIFFMTLAMAIFIRFITVTKTQIFSFSVYSPADSGSASRTGAVPTACRFTYQIFHAKQHPVESDTGQQ